MCCCKNEGFLLQDICNNQPRPSLALPSKCFAIFFSFLFFFFRAAPAAYGSSQARGPIGATVAGLHHSRSNARSKPCLQPTPQLTARDRTRNLMVPGPDSFPLCHDGNSENALQFCFGKFRIFWGHAPPASFTALQQTFPCSKLQHFGLASLCIMHMDLQ